MLAAPHATSSRVARYSFTARLDLVGSRSLQTHTPRPASGSSVPDQSTGDPSTNNEGQVHHEARTDREQCRSSAPSDLRGPRHRDETRRTVDLGHSSDGPSWIDPDAIRVNTTESRLAACLNRLLQQNLPTAEVSRPHMALSWMQCVITAASAQCCSRNRPRCSNMQHVRRPKPSEGGGVREAPPHVSYDMLCLSSSSQEID
jgi:hypothetical protein